MAITIQAKQLRQWMIELDIRERPGKLPTVRTQRIRRRDGYRRYTEFGNAYSIVPKKRVTPEQIAELKTRSEYIKVYSGEIYYVIHY